MLVHNSSILFFGKYKPKNSVPEGDNPSGYIAQGTVLRVDTLLTSYDGKAITYDEIGNPLSDSTWEHGRELTAMSDGTTTWTYAYDAGGILSF